MEEVNSQETSDPPAGRATVRARLRSGSRARWAAGIGTAIVLAGLIVFGAGLASAGGARPARAMLAASPARSGGWPAVAAAVAGAAPASASAVGVAAGPAGQSGPGGQRAAGALRGCMATARHLRATGHWLAARARLRACLRMFARFGSTLRALVTHAMHGQITFSTRQGARTLAFTHGTVRSISAGSLVVRAPDGTTWAWTLTSSTIITRAGRQVGSGALATGQRVVVVGQASGRADDARRVFVIG